MQSISGFDVVFSEPVTLEDLNQLVSSLSIPQTVLVRMTTPSEASQQPVTRVKYNSTANAITLEP